VTPRYLLPPEAYIATDWFEHEQRQVFTDRWALVASVDQFTALGDYVTAVVGTAPIVVLYDGERLAAFHNLCRHRGMVLLDGEGTVCTTVNCFYHQWRYGLDGTLRLVPQRKDQFPDLDPAAWGLLPAALDVWEGMVFVHPDPSADPLRIAMQGVIEMLGSHRPGLLRQVAFRRLEAACNWKLFVENHVDVYHLWHLHSTSLAEFDHTRFEHRQIGANWASYEPLKEGGVEHGGPATRAKAITHLDERDRRGLGAHLVFPNLMIASAAEFFATYVAIPLAPDRTVVELRIRAESSDDVDELTDAALSFIYEDIKACEAVQRGVRSPAFRVGPLAAEHEQPIENFHRSVLNCVPGTRR
jgi:Rieske 2Fe-2S family protein